MDSVNLNIGPATLSPGEPASSPVRPRNDESELQPGGVQQQNGPRVNEGPSTITSISPQALQLAQQDRASGGGETAGGPPNPPQGNNTTQQASASQTGETPDARSEVNPTQRDGGNAPANSEPEQSGRLINDQSPNDLLRN